MSVKPKGKVQAYGELAAFFRKSEPFLLQAEYLNNLFWEVVRKFREKGRTTWSGNVFEGGKICLSSLITPSGYLLVSHCRGDALPRLAAYGRKKNWKLKGVTGPSESVLPFRRCWMGGEDEHVSERSEFTIYGAACRRSAPGSGIFRLKAVEPESWPRVESWAVQFARESVPPLNSNVLLSMTKEMMLRKNLFFLDKEGVGPCAMGGFGRSTPNSLVINEVFVPRRMRRKGYGGELIQGLLGEAGARGYRKCILFSDFKGEENLYDRLGLERLGRFSERKFP
ncbi:MAG: GNAT family N-acetyltransferase [Verrucomicrobiota bacterium]|nr:GNAT family N-acetyltransferase [Verrucomicrobiota bacterium]